MFCFTKSIKFRFPWGTKLRDQKQEAGNDCDVISGLEALRKTVFSVIFWLWANKFAKKMVRKCTIYKKIRKCRRNLFPRNFKSWNDVTIIPSLPFFGLAVLYPAGSKIWHFWFIKTQGREIAIKKFFCYSYPYIVEILSSE